MLTAADPPATCLATLHGQDIVDDGALVNDTAACPAAEQTQLPNDENSYKSKKYQSEKHDLKENHKHKNKNQNQYD